MNRQHEQVIESWMFTVARDYGEVKLHDLHIDKVNPEWKSKPLWIEGGLESFKAAFNLRESHCLPFTLKLQFSLMADYQMRGIDFQTQGELASRLDWTPPSLYLIKRGTEPWIVNRVKYQEEIDRGVRLFCELPLRLFETSIPAGKCYYSEFRASEADEYFRSVFIEG